MRTRYYVGVWWADEGRRDYSEVFYYNDPFLSVDDAKRFGMDLANGRDWSSIAVYECIDNIIRCIRILGSLDVEWEQVKS